MKNKVFLLFFAIFIHQMIYSQNTWDTIMTGISKVSGYYPMMYGLNKIDGNLYVSSATKMYRSTDNGNNWSEITINGLMFYGANNFFKTSNGRLLALGGYAYTFIKSEDNGITWDTIPKFCIGCSGLDMFENSNGDLYASINSNTNMSLNGIWKSTDNGDTWSVVYSFPQTNQKVWTLFRLNDSTFLAGTSYGIYRSTDYGVSWTGVALNSSSNIISKIIQHSNGTLYAATVGDGILKSTNNGQTWTNSTTMGPSNSSAIYQDIDSDANGDIYVSKFGVGVVKFDANETYLEYFASDTNGLFNKRVKQFLIDESGSTPIYFINSESSTNQDGLLFRRGIALSTSISENQILNNLKIYPNPAKDAIRIANAPVGATLNITDITGKTVYSSIITNAQMQVNTSNLVSGVYMVQVLNEGQVSIQKLVINKN